MKKLILLVLLVTVSGLFSTVCLAQPRQRSLTLQDAIDIAKTQSPDALMSKQAFRVSFWNYRNFRASYLPSLRFDANIPQYVNTIRVVTDPQTKQEVFVPVQYLRADAGLSIDQQIGFSGGSISLNSDLTGIYNILPDSASFSTAPVNITLNQPLFQYNAYKWDKKIKPIEYSQAKQKYLEDVEQISITTTNYFFNLLNAQIELKIARTNLSNYDTLFQIAKGRYQLGKIAENDLLLLELNYLKAQAAVENAELSFENAMFRFMSYLRIKDSTQIELIPPSTITFFDVDPNEAILHAQTNSSTSLDFQRRLLVASSTVNAAKLNERFDAMISASVGITDDGQYLRDSYSAPMSQSEVIGFAINIPIYDWGVARGKIKIAESQEEIVKSSVEQEIIDFNQNVYLKVSQFNMQKNQVRIAAKADTVARKNYEVSKGRYLIGKLTSILDLNNAQIQTDNSEMSYYQALQTYWRNYFELRKLTLFDFRNNKALQFNFDDISL